MVVKYAVGESVEPIKRQRRIGFRVLDLPEYVLMRDTINDGITMASRWQNSHQHFAIRSLLRSRSVLQYTFYFVPLLE